MFKVRRALIGLIGKPTDEGGLEIRRLSHGKLMWQVLWGNSLWARFAQAKFGRGHYYLQQSRISPIWDSIVSHLPRLLINSQWIVGRGDISFWGVNWIGEILHGPLPCDLSLTLWEAWPILYQLRHFIHPKHHDQLARMNLSPNKTDRLVFTLSVSGDFSSKLYAGEIRTKGVKRPWASKVWLLTLPPKIATFLWKLVRQAVPVDNRLRAKGIQLASRCRCCSGGAMKTINHLFLHSDIAKALGNVLAPLLSSSGKFGLRGALQRSMVGRIIAQVQLLSTIFRRKRASSLFQNHILGLWVFSLKWCCPYQGDGFIGFLRLRGA